MFVALRVLGVDPGLTRCGYAVIDGGGPSAPKAVALGVIRTPASTELPERLALLHGELVALIAEFGPQAVAVEQVFFQVNVRTAMSVGQASGLALAAASHAGCVVAQYTPNQVKDAIAGWGAAPKAQVQKMVQMRLGLVEPPQPADAADAAALALCHLATAPLRHSVAAAEAAASQEVGSRRSAVGTRFGTPATPGATAAASQEVGSRRSAVGTRFGTPATPGATAAASEEVGS